MACPSANPMEKHCDACESQLRHSLFCSACSRVQALGEGENYFTIFGQSPCFDLDLSSIESAFDELILDLHPDFHTQGDARDQALSLQHSTLLQEAKETLLNPFERGKYLLRLMVPNIGNLTVHPPQDFIMEMFEYQEELDQLEENGSDPAELETKIQKEVSAGKNRLTQDFEQLANHRTDPSLIEEVKEALAKLKFILNLAERINQIKKTHG